MVRALRERGSLTPAELASAVGASGWEEHRFDRALALAVAGGLVQRTTGGRLVVDR